MHNIFSDCPSLLLPHREKDLGGTCSPKNIALALPERDSVNLEQRLIGFHPGRKPGSQDDGAKGGGRHACTMIAPFAADKSWHAERHFTLDKQ